MADRIQFVIVLAILAVPVAAFAEPVSSIQTRETWSPQNVILDFQTGGKISNTTYTVFYRQPLKESVMSGWCAAPGLVGVKPASAEFHGEHTQEYEFRSCISTEEGEEMTPLADFDRGEELDRVWMRSMIEGFNLAVKHDMDHPVQGIGCWRGRFIYVRDEFPEDLSEKSLFAALFTRTTPVKDWSPYRYLEFYYQGDVPGMQLYIKAASQTIKTPVTQFCEFDDAEPDGWRSIVVDLDEHLGKPEDRKKIESFSFITPIENLTPKKEYTIRLDGVRLWRTRRLAQIRVDTTPPTPAKDCRYEVKKQEIIWSWTPSVDEESGIEGYTYFLTRDRRKPVPMEIRTKETTVSIPFRKPSNYERWHFIVVGRNNAGMWSSKHTHSIEFVPKRTKTN